MTSANDRCRLTADAHPGYHGEWESSNILVESRKVVPLLPSRRRYDLLQNAEILAGRRPYARALTNDHVSDAPGDQ